MTNIKDQNINYLNKNFSDFKESLKSFAKGYFPNNYSDFKDADPETMMLEMSAYVGDVLSFYVDTQIQENLGTQIKEKENAIQFAYTMGSTPKMSYASIVDVDVYQVVEAATVGTSSIPNYSHAVTISEFTPLTSNNGTDFLTIEEVRFDEISTPDVIYRDNSSFYLKQTVKAISAEIKTSTFTFGSPKKFDKVSLNDSNILGIIKVEDNSVDPLWYEVSYLAEGQIITRDNNITYSADGVPYIVKYKNVPKRFISRFENESTLNLHFGAGVSSLSDSTIVPDMDNLSLGTTMIPPTYFQGSYNKVKNLFTREYGLAPSNCIITVTYMVGGGISSNILSNQINGINTSNVTFNVGDAYQSISATNPLPSVGGRSGDSLDEIIANALSSFQSQNRAVTAEDYTLRALSMPYDFGKVSKVFVSQNNDKSNPLALDLFLLSSDSNGNMVLANNTLKENVKTYLEQYRMVTDAINIKDAFIVNIGVNFDITINPGYSNSEVLTKCISNLKEYFDINKWQINQPIILSEVYSILLQTRGVQSVPKIDIINKQGTNYSQYGYDISGATRKNVIYPSMDPCIFEVKFPDSDISGRTISI